MLGLGTMDYKFRNRTDRLPVWYRFRASLSQHLRAKRKLLCKIHTMNNRFFIFMLLISVSMFGQAVPKTTPMPAKVYSGKPIAIIDPAKDNPVLVLYGNRQAFVKDAKIITDTLSVRQKYRILTDNDNISRYTNSKYVRKVVLISNP